MRAACVLVSSLVLTALAGCGSSESSGRFPVAGTITLKGQPVSSGVISFESQSGGVFSGGTIQNGKYSVPAAQGLMPGRYTVRISAAEPGTVAADPFPGESGPPAQNLVPPEFNARSQLEYEVTGRGTHRFDFDVP